MKPAALVVVLILLSCFVPNTAQGRRGKLLRMCNSRFSNCLSNNRFRRSYKAGAKCCGRAWTVCQLHRSSCLKICYPRYRGCMCKTGFSYYCWASSRNHSEDDSADIFSFLVRPRNCMNSHVVNFLLTMAPHRGIHFAVKSCCNTK